MAFYNTVKNLKSATVGTILPWGGDGASSKNGYENSTDLGLPKGWLICNGAQLQAKTYPLLTNKIGTTYGGSITGTYPDYNDLDYIVLPNLSNRHLADYKTSYLPSDSQVQTAISSKLGDNTDVSTSNTYSSNANLDFSLTASNNLVGKTTNVTLDDPNYFKLFYTVSRKLGQNHTPIHDHGGGYPSIEGTGVYAELYQTPSPNYEANGKRVNGYRGNGSPENNSPDTQGQLRFSVFEDNTESHVLTDGPKSYSGSSICGHPFDTGYIPLKSSQYPYTRTGNGIYKNWSNLNAQSTNVTYATTFNHNYDQWSSNPLPGGHNHGAFDITMNKGSLKAPKTIFHNDVQTHTATPQNLNSALTMTVDVNTPSMNIIYIIKAF